MKTARSKDDTTIAYDQTGSGPPLVLVDGALNSRAFGLNGPLAAILADRFTVVTYDRRGRGDSGDTRPYAVQREIEDLEAVIDTVGITTHVAEPKRPSPRLTAAAADPDGHAFAVEGGRAWVVRYPIAPNGHWCTRCLAFVN